MKTRKNKLRYGLLISTIAFTATAVAQDKPQTINIGVVATGPTPHLGGSYIATAHEQRLLEEEFRKDGIAIKWHLIKATGPGINEGFASKQLDFGSSGDLPSLIGKASGLNVKLILAGGRGYTFAIIASPKSGIQSIRDLKGKRVAFQKGTYAHLALNRVLEANGLKESDIKAFNMLTQAANAALLSGDIDAVPANSTYRYLEQGTGRVIYQTKTGEEIAQYANFGGFQVRGDFADKYPGITQRVVTTLVKAAAYSSDERNREALYKLWEPSGTPVAQYKAEYDGAPLAVRINPLLDDFFLQKYKTAVADAKRYNLIRRSVDVDQWADRRYVDRALKELKLEGYWDRQDSAGKVVSRGAAPVQ
jgi:sulfonate transport system substrate-binding protein